MNAPKAKKAKLTNWRTRWAVIGIEFVALFLFWILLSGRYEVKYVAIGLCAAGLVTYLTNDFLYFGPRTSQKTQPGIRFLLAGALRLILYIPWLTLAIVKANLQVASIILNPRMPIDPGLLKFKTRLRQKVSLVTLANSITLTPGTITVELKKDTYVVHALAPGAAGDIEMGLIQNKVRAVFSDNEEPKPRFSWAHSTRELE